MIKAILDQKNGKVIYGMSFHKLENYIGWVVRYFKTTSSDFCDKTLSIKDCNNCAHYNNDKQQCQLLERIIDANILKMIIKRNPFWIEKDTELKNLVLPEKAKVRYYQQYKYKTEEDEAFEALKEGLEEALGEDEEDEEDKEDTHMNDKDKKDEKYTQEQYNKLLKQLDKIQEIVMQEELPADNEIEEEDDELIDGLSKIETILKQKGFTPEEEEKLEEILDDFIKSGKLREEVEDKDLAELIDDVYEVYEDESDDDDDDDDYFKTIRVRLLRIKKRYLKGKLSSEDEDNLRESLINVLNNVDDRIDADEDIFDTLEGIVESLKR